MTSDNQLDAIYEKLQRLLKEYHAVQKENKQLKEKLEEYQHEISEKTIESQQLQTQLNAAKLSGSAVLNLPERESLKKRIDEYLREIDKCLLLLS